MGSVSDASFAACQCLGFARFVGSHCHVSGFKFICQYVGPDQILNKLANLPPSNDSMETRIYLGIKGDCQFPLHGPLLLSMH
jgi:hypothetical protein